MENLALQAKNEQCEQHICDLGMCIEQLQSQVFANYDESESIKLNQNTMTSKKINMNNNTNIENNNLNSNKNESTKNETIDDTEEVTESTEKDKEKIPKTSKKKLASILKD